MSTAISQFAALVLLAASLPGTAGSDPSTVVSAVVIDGGPGPKVIATYPADGAVVPAGVMAFKVVFSQAMKADGWSYSPSAGSAFPNCLGQPRLLNDQRTFVLLCTVAPQTHYVLQINTAGAFESAHGRAAKPIPLRFATAETGVRDMHSALVQAGLTDADEPIMRWRDPDAGKSASVSPPTDSADAAGD